MLVEIESDMRFLKPKPRESFNDFSDYIENLFESLPILGMAVFNESDRKSLFQDAYNIFQKLYTSESLTRREEIILVMDAIQSLKEHSSDEEESSMWSYICRQYGYRVNDSFGNSKVYAGFRKAISSVMRRYNRFFAPEGTQRYYTTLMLHALAPENGIFNLFEILVRFFEKNLQFQYIPNDPAYKVFVERIKTRWGIPSELERLGLYSATMYSGLKTLFLNRPNFMAVFCDNIVYKMNQLLQTGSILDGLLESSYLDKLLRKWYRDKSLHEKEEWSKSQKAHEEDRAVSTREANPQYVLEDNRVAIFFPNIRLSSAGDCDFPNIKINTYQDENLIFSKQMGSKDIFGDELSWTIRKQYLYLDELSIDFNKDLALRMEITRNQEKIYDSLERLYRPYIFFDEIGKEGRPENLKGGFTYLFVNDKAQLTSSGLEDAYQLPHQGRLLQVHVDAIRDLRIDGNEVFLLPADKSSVRVYPLYRSISGVLAQKEAQDFHIYDRKFYFSVHIPDDDSALSYLVSMDTNSSPVPLSTFPSEKSNVYCIESVSDGEFCELIIKHFTTSTVVYVHRYVVLEGFCLNYSEPFFTNRDVIQGNYSYQETDETFSVQLSGEETTRVVVLDRCWDLLISPPLLTCSLLGQDLFYNDSVFWYEDIGKEVHLRPSIPRGWRASVYIGDYTIAEQIIDESIDIGNHLNTFRHLSEKEKLWFSLIDSQEVQKRVFAGEIFFEPTFLQSPLQIMDGELIWVAENNYIGSSQSTFLVKLMNEGEEFANYRLICRDEIPEQNFPFKEGIFPYQVILQTQSLFKTDEKIIYEDSIVLGDKNKFRFSGQNVFLESCIYWDLEYEMARSVHISENVARISDIRYLGLSVPNGEELEFPKYQGTMSFFNTQKQNWQPFNDNKNKREYELINPVLFWVKNDGMLIVLTCTGDGLYFDKSRNSFMNKNPEFIMTKERLKAIVIPDSCTYRKEKI